MNNFLNITCAILLILSVVIIQSLVAEAKPIIDVEIIKFFTGICFGTAVGVLLIVIFGKKKSNEEKSILNEKK